MSDLRARFLETVKKYAMLNPGEDVLVAFSGGADSVCLLSLLYEYRDVFGIRLQAAHVNHGLRGADSDADERFAVSFCEKKQIPISVYRADINALAQKKKQSTELCAREVRYAFFSSLGADKIATAHTGSDAAETLLMNLLRGASLHGLCSIPPVRANVIRPLIGATRTEIEDFCRENDLPYVNDKTNYMADYTRNKFRLSVIPTLKQISPVFEHTALRCIDNLRMEDDYIAGQADTLFERAMENGRLNVSMIAASHPALCFRVLFRFCTEIAGSDVEEKHLRDLYNGMHTPGFAVTLPGGACVCTDGEVLFLKTKDAKPVEELCIRLWKNDLSEICFNEFHILFESRKTQPDDIFKPDFIDFYKIDDIIEIRSPRSGDMICLPRRNCTKTLKKYYTEQRIPAEERKHFPVIADSHGVIWAYGAGADLSRIAKNETVNILIIHTESDKNEQ